MTMITPENIAGFLWPSLCANGNVIEIKVTPADEDGDEDEDNAGNFCAVVAPVSEDGMLDGPLDIIGTPSNRVLVDLSDFSSLLDLSPEQAYQAAGQLIAAAALGNARAAVRMVLDLAESDDV